MSDVRYAPPQARLRSASTAGPGGEIDVGRAFNEGWSATWANFPLALAVYAVGGALILLSTMTFVGLFLFVPALVWGLVRFNLNALDGRAEFADLFSGFGDYGRATGTVIVLVALMVVIGLLGLSVSIAGAALGSLGLRALGILVSLVFPFAVMPRLAFAWYYAIEREMGPVEALQAAWDATTGQSGTCLVLAILSAVLKIMGLLSLVVGLIPAVMIVYLMQASAFRQLAGRQTDAA